VVESRLLAYEMKACWLRAIVGNNSEDESPTLFPKVMTLPSTYYLERVSPQHLKTHLALCMNPPELHLEGIQIRSGTFWIPPRASCH